MISYKLIVTEEAESDLADIFGYIANQLKEKATAVAYVRDIRKIMASLSTMPRRNKVVDDEPWHSRSIRRIIARKFYVYYRVDEDEQAVYILAVVYTRRDQSNALK